MRAGLSQGIIQFSPGQHFQPSRVHTAAVDDSGSLKIKIFGTELQLHAVLFADLRQLRR